MPLHLPDFLSYLIRPDGESVACVPAEDEFSIKHLQDAVGALPELVCFTSEGYSLFRDRDGESKKLAVNEIATAIWRDAVPDRTEMIFGPVFLAHPAHIPVVLERDLSGARADEKFKTAIQSDLRTSRVTVIQVGVSNWRRREPFVALYELP